MQKYIKILWLYCLFFIVASGCTRSIPSAEGDIDSIFQCQNDVDCVSEETACNNCWCPRAVNINYKADVDCTKLDPNDPVAKYGCNLACPVLEPRCSNQTCVMK
jgi:hypothetical protein